MAQSIEGGVQVVGQLSVKNNGDYFLVDSESVSFKGKRLDETLNELQTVTEAYEEATDEEIQNLFN